MTLIALDASIVYGSTCRWDDLKQVHDCINAIVRTHRENREIRALAGAAMSNFGIFLEEQGDVDGAKAAFEKGIELGNDGATRGLGVLLEREGDVDGAELAFEKGIELGDGRAAFKSRCIAGKGR